MVLVLWTFAFLSFYCSSLCICTKSEGLRLAFQSFTTCFLLSPPPPCLVPLLPPSSPVSYQILAVLQEHSSTYKEPISTRTHYFEFLGFMLCSQAVADLHLFFAVWCLKPYEFCLKQHWEQIIFQHNSMSFHGQDGKLSAVGLSFSGIGIAEIWATLYLNIVRYQLIFFLDFVFPPQYS